MKIIDMNVCIGKADVHGKIVDLQALLQMMEQNNIEHAVAYHEYALAEHKSGNALMQKISEESNGKVGICAVIDPGLGAESLPGEGSLADRLRQMKAECVRIFPTANRVVFSSFYLDEVFSAVNELSMPLIIDDDFGAPPTAIFGPLPEIAKEYPNAKFVIIRYGTCGGRNVMPLIKKTKNVYFTIEQMLDHMQIEEICECGGADKLLFGSEYPSLPLAGALGLSFYADITDEERQKILYKNWEAIGYDD